MAVRTLSGPLTGASLNPGDQTTRVRPTDAAFGGGTARALQSLGQDIGAVAERGSDFLMKEQALANESMTRDALTDFDKKAADLWTGFSSLEGQAAVDGYKGYQDALTQLRQQTIASAPNEAMKMALNSVVTQRSGQYYASAGDYRARQDKAWSLQSSASAAEQATRNATNFRYNPEIVSERIGEGEGEIRNQAEIHGWDEITTGAKIAEYRGKAYGDVIQSLAQENPLAAQSMFDSVRTSLDAGSQGSISAWLKPKVLDAKSDAIVAGAAGGNGDFLRSVRSAESGGDDAAKNPNSSATGRYQFTKGTWKDLADRRPELGLTAEGRTDPDQQERAMRVFTEENRQKLADATGRTPDNGGLYLAHFLGASDAAKVLKADPGTPVAGLVDNDSIAANQSVLAGKTAGDVRAWASGKVSGGSMPSAADKQRAIRDVMAATEGDPDLRSASLSKLNGYYNQQDSLYAQDRAVLERDVKSTNEALQFGQSVAIPEERIRSLLPSDDAERVIGALQRSQLQGQMYNSVKMSDPGQISEMRQDLMTGTGTLSEMIRRTNPMAEEAEQFTQRQDALQAFEAAVKKRDEAIRADPARFSLQDPAVRSSMERATNDPAQFGEYVAATQAFQTRLGIPRSQQRVLTDDQRVRMIGSFTQSDPKKAADDMVNLQREVGDAWGDVFGELTRGPDGLPGPMLALGIMTDPGARTALTNALQQENEKPGTIRGGLPDETAKSIDLRVEDQTTEFANAFAVLGGGQLQADGLIKATKTLAYAFAKQGMGEREAIDKAVEAISGRYDVMVSSGRYNAIAPKNMGDTMADAVDVTLSQLRPEDLAPLRDVRGIYDPEMLDQNTVENAQRGQWITSPSGDGWTLLGNDGAIVRRRDGAAVTIQFDDAQRIADTQSMRMLGSDTGIITAPTVPQAAAQGGITEEQAAENARKRTEQRRRLFEGE